MKFVKYALATALFVLPTAVAPPSSAEENWSTWRSFVGENVSVSFSQVNRETWTWKFRNDGGTAITYMAFQYADKDGSHNDVLPFTLQPGQAFGGWAAFTASSNPTIRIVKITRK